MYQTMGRWNLYLSQLDVSFAEKLGLAGSVVWAILVVIGRSGLR